MSPSRPSLSKADLVRFRDLVRAKSGLEFPEARQPEFERIVCQTLEQSGLPDMDALYRHLTDPELGRAMLRAMIAALTIGETHFFRNQPQFEALEGRILPEIIARRRAVRQLRIWSAGCATGEEPYSIAILLERLVPDLADWDVRLLATDINPQALEKARRGVYTNWSFRQVPGPIQAEYFTGRGREFEIVPRIRERVTFAYLNLIEDHYPSLLTHTQAMDLILCRNVLIYFREETIRQVIGRFHQALADQGWLIVGHSEPSQSIFHQFAVHNFPGAVVYQKRMDELRTASIADCRLPIADSVEPQGHRGTEKTEKNQETRIPDTELQEIAPPASSFGSSSPCLDVSGVPPNPQSGHALDLARAHADRMEWDEAERWIEAVLKEEPLSAAAHYLHGLILQERGNRESALAAFRRCVFADARFVMGHYALAGLLSQGGQVQRARKSLDNVVELLRPRPREELVPEGDGLSVGRLLDLVAVQRQL